MKKIISLVFVFITISTMSMYSAQAKKDYLLKYTPDKFEHLIDGIYYIIEDDDLIANKYAVATYSKRKGSVLKYPNYIRYKNRKYKVKIINPDYYREYSKLWGYKFSYTEVYLPKYAEEFDLSSFNLSKLRKIHISKNVTTQIRGLENCKKLKVIIDKKNKHIKMKNGAIYSKNGKKLISLITGKKTYKISKGTKKLIVRENNKVKTLILPNEEKFTGYNSVEECNELKTIKFRKNTEVIDLQIINCKKLKKIKFGKNTRKFIGQIRGVNSLESIEFPNTFVSFGTNLNIACIYAENLSKIVFNNEKHSPIVNQMSFSVKRGANFYVKNQQVADELAKSLVENTGVRDVNIFINNKLAYSNITGKGESEDYEWDT